MNYDIICAGLATHDMILSPIPENIMETDGAVADHMFTGSGGDAVNTAISLAKMGVRVCISACVGDDSFANVISADLEAAGASTEGLVRDPSVFTNSPVVLLSAGGERHIIRTAKGGNRFYHPGLLPDSLLAAARHLHIASVNMLPKLDGAPLAELFRKAKEKGLTTSMDASFDKTGLWIRQIADVLPHCDIFIPSFQEAIHYAGSEDLDEITRFFSRYNLRCFGVKLGAKGVFVTDFEHRYRLPSLYTGTPVDTTGAGDAFFAGFLAGYLKGLDLRSCALTGSAQSAFVMRSVGANRSAGTWDEITDFIARSGHELRTRGGDPL